MTQQPIQPSRPFHRLAFACFALGHRTRGRWLLAPLILLTTLAIATNTRNTATVETAPGILRLFWVAFGPPFGILIARTVIHFYEAHSTEVDWPKARFTSLAALLIGSTSLIATFHRGSLAQGLSSWPGALAQCNVASLTFTNSILLVCTLRWLGAWLWDRMEEADNARHPRRPSRRFRARRRRLPVTDTTHVRLPISQLLVLGTLSNLGLLISAAHFNDSHAGLAAALLAFGPGILLGLCGATLVAYLYYSRLMKAQADRASESLGFSAFGVWLTSCLFAYAAFGPGGEDLAKNVIAIVSAY